MKKSLIYCFIFSSFLLLQSCSLEGLSNTSIFILFGLLLLCFIVMFILLFKVQKNEHKMMNKYIANVSNMLNNCTSTEHKIRELNILIKRIKEDPKYTKNKAWQNKILAKTYLFLATIYYKENDENNTLDICTKIIELAPHDAVTLYNRGALYLNRGEYKKAIEDFSASILLENNNVNAYNNRGLAYEKSEQNDKALADYQIAIEHEQSPITYLNLGNLYRKTENYNVAKECYEKALQICDDEKLREIIEKNINTLQ